MDSQTIKADKGKEKLSLVPTEIIRNIAVIREYGTQKYGNSENWKEVEADRYKDAAYRHFIKYIEDPHGLDDESNLPHLWHLACNIAFLCELEKGALNEAVNYRRISRIFTDWWRNYFNHLSENGERKNTDNSYEELKEAFEIFKKRYDII